MIQRSGYQESRSALQDHLWRPKLWHSLNALMLRIMYTYYVINMHAELTGITLSAAINSGCKSLFDADRAINMARERRVEIAYIGECLKLDGISSIWACADEQLADELTKIKTHSISEHLEVGTQKT